MRAKMLLASAASLAALTWANAASAQDARPAAGDGLSVVATPADSARVPAPYAIAVRVDPTQVDPVLAVSLADSQRVVVTGQPSRFVRYTNYPSYIERAELRLFKAGDAADATPLAVVAAAEDGSVSWTPEVRQGETLTYVYRVYSRDGRFDETRPQELTVVGQPLADAPAVLRPLHGARDQAVVRTIPLRRAKTVVVTGQVDPATETVRVSGVPVPIEPDGRFVSQQLVPRDTAEVDIAVTAGEDRRYRAVREVGNRQDDWFVVAQGDLTLLSRNGGAAGIEVSGNPAADGEHLASRAAFYVKGSLANGVRITSSLDTGETLLRDLFSNLDRKDPRELLRRLDTSRYYPTYGDDSTLVEDAPTQGRFYLRVEKNRSSLLVGNFIADIDQAELAQLNRGVFGAIVDHRSMATTSFGESRFQATAFAADPGTIPARDEFRGTGGSLYFLKRRDITVGSERLSVEVRDRDTGIVLSRQDLRPQDDYDIDYFQGRVSLLRPIGSYAATEDLVRTGSGPGNVPVLVVRYEYAPLVGDLSGYTLGGRVSGWIGNNLRLGATAQRETTGSADQTLLAADATLRLHPGTYLKTEIAQSEGPGFGQSGSVDGGLTFSQLAAPGTAGIAARAYRAEFAADFAELAGRTGDRGKASAFYERVDAGFSGNGMLAPHDSERWGAAIEAPLGGRTNLIGKFERLTTDTIGQRTVASAQVRHDLGGGVELGLGVRHDEQAAGLPFNSHERGNRTDGAIEVRYRPDGEIWSLHGFAQATLDRDAGRRRNNRAGIGGKIEISDRLSFAGEISGGDGGLGASVELSHRYGNGSEAYLGYSLITERTDLGLEPMATLTQTNRGQLTLGARHRFSSALSIRGENKLLHAGDAPSVMHSFGLDWTPSEHWSVTGSFENGHVDDVQTGLFRRTAATFGLGYTDTHVQLASNVEARFEQGVQVDQRVWLVRNSASIRFNEDWRALGRLNFAIADTDSPDVRAADFVEGTIGIAYRPVHNERVNLLARYTYLSDMGPVGQVTANNALASPKQRSEVLSIDGNFDLTRTVTLGAKYAFRTGSVSLGRDSDVFVSSTTHLGVGRIDWRLIRRWDALAELHYLSNDRAGDSRLGGVVALYRHLGNSVKVGVGYSFSDFSTDLTNQSYTSSGWFINLLGKL